jgi:hypothetical protein
MIPAAERERIRLELLAEANETERLDREAGAVGAGFLRDFARRLERP